MAITNATNSSISTRLNVLENRASGLEARMTLLEETINRGFAEL